MFPKKYEPILFGFLLSGLMSLLVSGISTLRTMGLVTGFMNIWIGAWLMAWLIAFPVVLIAAPFTRRVVYRLVEQ
jgi:hypothetical protein